MKDVYIKNPQMGDPTSVDPRLTEIAVNIEKLQSEVQKFEVGSRVQTEYFSKIRGNQLTENTGPADRARA